jgi:hypothetical protein
MAALYAKEHVVIMAASASDCSGKMILCLHCLCSLDRPISVPRLPTDTSISLRGSYASGSKMITEMESTNEGSYSTVDGYFVHLKPEYRSLDDSSGGPEIPHDCGPFALRSQRLQGPRCHCSSSSIARGPVLWVCKVRNCDRVKSVLVC